MPKLIFKSGFWWVECLGKCDRTVYRQAVKWATLRNYALYPSGEKKSMAAGISAAQMKFVPVLEPIQRY